MYGRADSDNGGIILQIYFNKNRKMDLKNFTSDSTVKDYLDALDKFLEENPAPCFTCSDNCCERDWNIELDIVFFNRLLNEKAKDENEDFWFLKLLDQYVTINQVNGPVFKHTPCQFLNKEGLCKIYEKRTFICRGYTCHPETERYKVLRGLIGHALNLTLLIKIKQKQNQESLENVSTVFEIDNPEQLPLEATDYNINISNLVESVKSSINDYEYQIYLTF
jgi:Fe-S-cluster containining protein